MRNDNKPWKRQGFAEAGKVVKTILSPATHLRNILSAKAFKKKKKKKGEK